MKDITKKSAHGLAHHRAECECDVCYPQKGEAVSDKCPKCGAARWKHNNILPCDIDPDKCRVRELEQENARLRAALANSKDPCIYCQLPKDDMAKCKSGFPGCGRADDMTSCPEFGAMLEVDHLKAEVERLRVALKEADEWDDRDARNERQNKAIVEQYEEIERLKAQLADQAAKVEQAVREIESQMMDVNDEWDEGYYAGARDSLSIIRRIFQSPAKDGE